MSSQKEIKNDLKNLSMILARIHKGLMNCQMQSREERTGAALTPAAKLQLLLSDPEFNWLRVLSLLIVKVDDSVFSREEVAASTVTELKEEIKALLIDQTNEEFTREFLAIKNQVPDVLKEIDALTAALSGAPPLLH